MGMIEWILFSFHAHSFPAVALASQMRLYWCRTLPRHRSSCIEYAIVWGVGVCVCFYVRLCVYVGGGGVIEQCESLWDDCDTSHRHWMVVASHHTKSSMPFRWPPAKFIYNNEIATPEQRSKRKNMNPHTTTVIHVDYNLLYVGILLLLFFFCFSLLFRDFRLSSRPHRRSIYIYRMFVLWLNI